MTRSVADQFVDTLVAAGVKRIFGVVGDSLNGLTDVVRRRGDIVGIRASHEHLGQHRVGVEGHGSYQLLERVHVHRNVVLGMRWSREERAPTRHHADKCHGKGALDSMHKLASLSTDWQRREHPTVGYFRHVADARQR